MPNAKTVTIRDFSGGVNDVQPPDQLADNESAKLVNMVAGDEQRPLAVRKGDQTAQRV